MRAILPVFSSCVYTILKLALETSQSPGIQALVPQGTISSTSKHKASQQPSTQGQIESEKPLFVDQALVSLGGDELVRLEFAIEQLSERNGSYLRQTNGTLPMGRKKRAKYNGQHSKRLPAQRRNPLLLPVQILAALLRILLLPLRILLAPLIILLRLLLNLLRLLLRVLLFFIDPRVLFYLFVVGPFQVANIARIILMLIARLLRLLRRRREEKDEHEETKVITLVEQQHHQWQRPHLVPPKLKRGTKKKARQQLPLSERRENFGKLMSKTERQLAYGLQLVHRIERIALTKLEQQQANQEYTYFNTILSKVHGGQPVLCRFEQQTRGFLC